MTNRLLLLVAMGALVVSGLLVRAGRIDNKQDLESVARLWGDVFWDTSRTTGKVAHVSLAEETALGNDLARSLVGVWAEDGQDLPRVLTITGQLAQHVRRRLRYTPHVIDSPDLNAFSLPGGHIYVTKGLLTFVQNDSELAGVLGHEMAHIDLEHCLEQHRYEAVLKARGAAEAGALLDLMRQVTAFTYSQQQEFDADARGAYLASMARYDPRAVARVFRRLDTATRNARSQGMLRPYFQSHPSSAERADRLEKIVAQQTAR